MSSTTLGGKANSLIKLKEFGFPVPQFEIIPIEIYKAAEGSNFKEMPASKKFGNTVMNMITRIFYGIHVNDSQSGLRAFNRKAARVLDISSRGYGVSSEIIGEIKKYNLKVEEVEIRTIYTDYSMSKGTNLIVGLKILGKLIINILK